MSRLAATLALALALAAAPAAAAACSPRPGYSVPTNFELAQAANLIVIGEVVGGGTGSPADPDAPAVTVHPVASVKGLMPGADFKLGGMTLATPGDAAANAVSDPLAFGDPHPAALTGGCIRRAFPQGARVLFFLKRENGAWAPAGGPFSRWAEDVSGPQAPWTQLARFYAQAAMLPTEDGREWLEEQHEALLARADDPEAAAMAADLERSLAGPTPPAPGPNLEAGHGAEAPPDLETVKAAIDRFGERR